ncbi:hypothetical protein BDD43_5652 [Mucilaginibacter gracilis]|uniref:Uncharacterized protein n=1 Tax=Mucilaginibacter gracilis TaxID=423350 RepID=A0A495J9B9_9SPHI|nr:hypothetical protein BDD43_5652 [Mucilaginibacter gracilis]
MIYSAKILIIQSRVKTGTEDMRIRRQFEFGLESRSQSQESRESTKKN